MVIRPADVRLGSPFFAANIALTIATVRLASASAASSSCGIMLPRPLENLIVFRRSQFIAQLAQLTGNVFAHALPLFIHDLADDLAKEAREVLSVLFETPAEPGIPFGVLPDFCFA